MPLAILTSHTFLPFCCCQWLITACALQLIFGLPYSIEAHPHCAPTLRNVIRIHLSNTLFALIIPSPALALPIPIAPKDFPAFSKSPGPGSLPLVLGVIGNESVADVVRLNSPRNTACLGRRAVDPITNASVWGLHMNYSVLSAYLARETISAMF